MRERQAEEATRREAFEVRSDEGRSHRKTGETCFSQASRYSEMVPVGGLEPPLPQRNRILNPACLPISPHWHRVVETGAIIAVCSRFAM